MAANLPLVIAAVLGLFGIFMAALGYAQYQTRTILADRQRQPNNLTKS